MLSKARRYCIETLRTSRSRAMWLGPTTTCVTMTFLKLCKAGWLMWPCRLILSATSFNLKKKLRFCFSNLGVESKSKKGHPKHTGKWVFFPCVVRRACEPCVTCEQVSCVRHNTDDFLQARQDLHPVELYRDHDFRVDLIYSSVYFSFGRGIWIEISTTDRPMQV